MQQEKDLLYFLNKTEEKLRVMVIEGNDYLPRLRELMPNAELHAVTSDKEEAGREKYKGLDINWCFVAYSRETIPRGKSSFDYIIAETCLDDTANPQDMLYGMNFFLKDTGYLLTSARNIRYWKTMTDLLEGHFYYVCKRVFALHELQRLLAAAFFKDVSLYPIKGEEMPAEAKEKLAKADFADLSREAHYKKWLLKVSKSKKSVLELKRLYTSEIRQRLVTTLRRIEYGMDVEANFQGLLQLIHEHKIFPAYLATIIHETIIYKNNLLWFLIPAFKQAGEMELLKKIFKEIAPIIGDMKEINNLEVEALLENMIAWQENSPCPLELPGKDMRTVMDSIMSEGASKVGGKQKVAFISCVNDEEMYNEALLYLSKLYLPEGMEAEIVTVRDAGSMCEGYNVGMASTDALYKVYLHQDVFIVNKNFIFDILELYKQENMGLVGVIGAKNLPSHAIWWEGRRCYGEVIHACEAESVEVSKCLKVTEDYEEVEALDGLLMVTNEDIPWREELFTGWHFYDISQCKEFQRQGKKVVVAQQDKIWCVHATRQKPLERAYYLYQKIFLDEYGNELNPEV